MEYKKKLGILEESKYRAIWKEEYCNHRNPIYTFDGIRVKFFEDMFDHAFFESDDWRKKDKSIFSLNRAVRMLWIKIVLQDPKAVLKEGWDNKTGYYHHDKRTAVIVSKSYIVVIKIMKEKEARFVTAYEIDEDGLEKVLNGPDWAKK